MKLKTTVKTIIISAFISNVSFGAIAWLDSGVAAYTAATPPASPNLVTFTAAGANGTASQLAFQGIQLQASSNFDASNFRANGNNISFVPANAIGAGETICFDFSFNILMSSANPRPFGAPGSNVRAATRFLVASNLDSELDITFSGGNFNASDFTSPAPVAGVNYYQNTTSDITYDGVDGTRGSVFTSVSGNTLTVEDDLANNTSFLADVYDRSRDVNTNDFSYTNVTFKYTNLSDTEIPAGTNFTFTFEGANPEQQALIVPEPTSFSLLGLATLGLLSRRKRA